MPLFDSNLHGNACKRLGKVFELFQYAILEICTSELESFKEMSTVSLPVPSG